MDEQQRKTYIEQHGDKLLHDMLQIIGTSDDELRDKLNYRVFIELLSAGHWTREQMTEITKTLVDDAYLFAAIGSSGDDSVFTRSFSALWLAGLLQVDRQIRFLSDEQATAVLQAVVPYIQKERDVRGFVEGKGWAHSMAHGSDLAVAAISHPLFTVQLAPVILQGLKEAMWKGAVFVDDEDERFVQVVEALVRAEFPEEVLVEWVEQLFDKLDRHLYEVGYNPAFFAARTNTMHFMKTLYFALKFSNHYQQLRGVCSIFIGKWMKY